MQPENIATAQIVARSVARETAKVEIAQLLNRVPFDELAEVVEFLRAKVEVSEVAA